MNERIKELIPKAYELVRKSHDGYFTQELLLNYMAILVVQECANICGKDSLDYRYIKEHFGVEK